MKYSILVQCALKPLYIVTGQSLSRVKDRVVKMEMKRGANILSNVVLFSVESL